MRIAPIQKIIPILSTSIAAYIGWALGRRFATEPATGCVTGPVLPLELETPEQIWFERSGSKLPNRYVTTAPAGTDRDGPRPNGMMQNVQRWSQPF